LVEENNLTFSIMKEPDLPEVLLNEDSIERAIKNLISNAIKYSPKGGRIKVRAERARVGEFVEVSIEDQGVGIPEQYHAKIFDRFFRIENDTHTIKGTGLGLHLVKISVEKHHGGQVFIHSKVNEGSTFGFRLPINPPKEVEEELPTGVTNFNDVDEEEYIPKLHPPEPSDGIVQDDEVGLEDLTDEQPGGWQVSLEKREV